MDPQRIASTAQRLIEENGVPVILEAVAGEYDTDTSKVEGGARSHTAMGFPYEYDLKDIDGDLVRAGDVRVLLAVKTTSGDPMPEPKHGNRLHFDDAYWSVQRCSPIKLKGQAVVYSVHARK